MSSGLVRSILIGKAVPFARQESKSAIFKTSIAHPLQVGWLGLVGDEQADTRHHGGPDKAIHGYAWSHYSDWQRELPQCAAWDKPGAFGENLSIEGLNEASVCIGDRWQAGTAVLEVTQGRQPCWKLNYRFGVADMSSRVQNSLRAGWYYKVVEPGVIAPGDSHTLLERPYPAWTVERLLALIRDRCCEVSTLQEALNLPLPPSWQKLFSRRAELQEVEDWESRMNRH